MSTEPEFKSRLVQLQQSRWRKVKYPEPFSVSRARGKEFCGRGEGPLSQEDTRSLLLGTLWKGSRRNRALGEILRRAGPSLLIPASKKRSRQLDLADNNTEALHPPTESVVGSTAFPATQLDISRQLVE